MDDDRKDAIIEVSASASASASASDPLLLLSPTTNAFGFSLLYKTDEEEEKKDMKSSRHPNETSSGSPGTGTGTVSTPQRTNGRDDCGDSPSVQSSRTNITHTTRHSMRSTGTGPPGGVAAVHPRLASKARAWVGAAEGGAASVISNTSHNEDTSDSNAASGSNHLVSQRERAQLRQRFNIGEMKYRMGQSSRSEYLGGLEQFVLEKLRDNGTHGRSREEKTDLVKKGTEGAPDLFEAGENHLRCLLEVEDRLNLNMDGHFEKSREKQDEIMTEQQVARILADRRHDQLISMLSALLRMEGLPMDQIERVKEGDVELARELILKEREERDRSHRGQERDRSSIFPPGGNHTGRRGRIKSGGGIMSRPTSSMGKLPLARPAGARRNVDRVGGGGGGGNRNASRMANGSNAHASTTSNRRLLLDQRRCLENEASTGTASATATSAATRMSASSAAGSRRVASTQRPSIQRPSYLLLKSKCPTLSRSRSATTGGGKPVGRRGGSSTGEIIHPHEEDTVEPAVDEDEPVDDSKSGADDTGSTDHPRLVASETGYVESPSSPSCDNTSAEKLPMEGASRSELRSDPPAPSPAVAANQAAPVADPSAVAVLVPSLSGGDDKENMSSPSGSPMDSQFNLLPPVSIDTNTNQSSLIDQQMLPDEARDGDKENRRESTSEGVGARANTAADDKSFGLFSRPINAMPSCCSPDLARMPNETTSCCQSLSVVGLDTNSAETVAARVEFLIGRAGLEESRTELTIQRRKEISELFDDLNHWLPQLSATEKDYRKEVDRLSTNFMGLIRLGALRKAPHVRKLAKLMLERLDANVIASGRSAACKMWANAFGVLVAAIHDIEDEEHRAHVIGLLRVALVEVLKRQERSLGDTTSAIRDQTVSLCSFILTLTRYDGFSALLSTVCEFALGVPKSNKHTLMSCGQLIAVACEYSNIDTLLSVEQGSRGNIRDGKSYLLSSSIIHIVTSNKGDVKPFGRMALLSILNRDDADAIKMRAMRRLKENRRAEQAFDESKNDVQERFFVLNKKWLDEFAHEAKKTHLPKLQRKFKLAT